MTVKKYIIGFSFLLVSLPLSYADLAAQGRALDAEARRYDAQVLAMNARCKSFVIGSALDVQCHRDLARLNAWKASILARVAALQAKIDAGDSTTSGAFGTKNANPKLVPAEKGTIGSNEGAGAQLKAAAKEAERGDQSDFRKNYDAGGAQSDGSLVYARGSQRDQISAVPGQFQDAKKYPEIMRYDQEAKRAAAQRDKLDQEIAKLERQGASATNQAGVELANKRSERTAAQSAVDAAEANKKERIRIAESKM